MFLPCLVWNFATEVVETEQNVAPERFEVFTAVFMYTLVVMDVTCRPLVTDVSERRTASIFRV